MKVMIYVVNIVVLGRASVYLASVRLYILSSTFSAATQLAVAPHVIRIADVQQCWNGKTTSLLPDLIMSKLLELQFSEGCADNRMW